MRTDLPATGPLRVKADQLMAEWATLPISRAYYVDHVNMYNNGTIQLTIKPKPGGEGAGDTGSGVE